MTETKKKQGRISQEVKMAIVRERYIEGAVLRDIARKHGVGLQSVHRIIRSFAAENEQIALSNGERSAKLLKAFRRAFSRPNFGSLR